MSDFAKRADAFAIELVQFINNADVSKAVGMGALSVALLAVLRQCETTNMPPSARVLLATLPEFIDDLVIQLMDRDS